MGFDVTSRLADQRVTEWFLRERARSSQQQEEVKKPPAIRAVITISRQFGAGGHTVAEMLLQRLGRSWQVWDKEIIDAIAHHAEMRKEMVEALDEHTQSWIEQMVRNILTLQVMEPLGYRRHLSEVLLALAQQGHKIIVGRGANFVLKEALNIRLRASLEFRAQNTMQRENISHAAAIRQIHQVDRDRAEFTRSVFERDVDNPDNYDMTLQTDTLGFPAAVEAIIGAARVMFPGEIA
jgi:cytidylate kinase